MKILQQIIRGCGELPHVGEHPGNFFLLMFVLIGALAGAQTGWYGALGGAILMLLFMGPLYLMGAYDRAQLSDRLSEKEAKKQADSRPLLSSPPTLRRVK